MKTLSGKEASLLALLAQSSGSDISQDEIDRVLSMLTGDARQIGDAIVALSIKTTVPEQDKFSKEIREAAEGFIGWAQSMRKAK